MKVGWTQMGKFWHSEAPEATKRMVFYSKVVEAGLSGMEAFDPTDQQLNQMDSQVCKPLRSMEAGKACKWDTVGKAVLVDNGTLLDEAEGHPEAVANWGLLRKWRILPMRFELAARRVAYHTTRSECPDNFGHFRLSRICRP